jgi:urease accessory protein
MQLCDSASPIGAAAHSFGLETLAAEGMLAADRLVEFLAEYLSEAGVLEARFCRMGYTLSGEADGEQFSSAWLEVNSRLSALKPARESRAASAMLGRRFLLLVLGLEEQLLLRRAVQTALQAGVEIHYATAFGLACGVLGFDEDAMVLAYLQQQLAGLIFVCQRLLPVGQSQASSVAWALKPTLLQTAQRSGEDIGEFCFMPLVDLGGMRHQVLHTRLFMS